MEDLGKMKKEWEARKSLGRDKVVGQKKLLLRSKRALEDDLLTKSSKLLLSREKNELLIPVIIVAMCCPSSSSLMAPKSKRALPPKMEPEILSRQLRINKFLPELWPWRRFCRCLTLMIGLGKKSFAANTEAHWREDKKRLLLIRAGCGRRRRRVGRRDKLLFASFGRGRKEETFLHRPSKIDGDEMSRESR